MTCPPAARAREPSAAESRNASPGRHRDFACVVRMTMLGYARSMIEIIVLIMFVRNLARTAEQKGRSKAWGGLGAAGWLGGEVMGGVVGGIAGAESGAIYGLALVG